MSEAAMQDFEKLGSFYLGKEYDCAAAAVKDDPILYNANDLTTHAMLVGMTGSGKTGLALALLEEAAIDGIPSILIDFKLSMSLNHLLASPGFFAWRDGEPLDVQRLLHTPEGKPRVLAAGTAPQVEIPAFLWDA